MINVQLDTSELDQSLRHLSQATSNLYPPLDEIGDALESNIALLFVDQQSPDGQPWKPLSDVTLQRRRQGSGSGSSQILQDSGILKNSFTHHADRHSVAVGTAVEYAPTHQFGATKGQYAHGVPWGDIPARPFMPEERLPTDWENEVMDIITQHLEDAL